MLRTISTAAANADQNTRTLPFDRSAPVSPSDLLRPSFDGPRGRLLPPPCEKI